VNLYGCPDGLTRKSVDTHCGFPVKGFPAEFFVCRYLPTNKKCSL
jgi:hypothetical protein